MGLDITIRLEIPNYCPHCGKIASWDEGNPKAYSGGREWYRFLEEIGYYTDTEDDDARNKWYGKDMVLPDEQIKNLATFVADNKVVDYRCVLTIVGEHLELEGSRIVVNADW